jgi:C-terminal processing protease CtpA/Prc
LSDVRQDIALPTYSVDEKKIVLDQAYLVMSEIFVHRELKMTNFGSEIDPLPMVKSLQGKVDSLSDKDFHNELTNIFSKQNDLHTSYSYPKPYSCYMSYLPFSFKEIIKRDGQKSIAVNKIVDTKEVIDLVPDLKVQIGDILISYNGIAAYEAAQSWATRSRGANPPATHRRSINLLAFTNQKTQFLPEKDLVDLVFLNRQGKTYSVSIPWISRADTKCLTPEVEIEEIGKIEESMGSDHYQNEFNRIYRFSKKPLRNKMLNVSPLIDTAEPILKYKIEKNEYGDFGYIRLESFVPEKMNINELIQEIKKILFKDFAKTDGLIFDLRNNGGGYIAIAEKLVQLFTPKNPIPLNFILKNSAANRHVMYEAEPDDEFTVALRNAEAAGALYTTGLPLHPANEIDLIGQYYFKPVALLTNANCYSSCDMFSALMQDHEAAIIFGEDSTTGAGGANNFDHASTIRILGDNLGPYQKLPSGQDIGFAFRQTLRTGPSVGVLIEDRGVLSDQVVPATLSDLYSESGDQLKIIGKVLNESSQDFSSWVKVNEGRQDVLINNEPTFFIQWKQTDKIEFKENRTSLEEIEVELDNQIGRDFPFPKQLIKNQFEVGKMELIGKKNNKRVWRKFQQYRMIPESLPLEENLVINLETGASNPLAIYNDGNQAQQGWIIQDGMLKSGSGDEYADAVQTEASIFVILNNEKDFTLNFDAQVNTEKDFDYFRVKLTVEGKEIELIPGLSGEEAIKTYSFNLDEYKGQKVEVRFIFSSDTGVTGKGVILKNLSFTSN